MVSDFPFTLGDETATSALVLPLLLLEQVEDKEVRNGYRDMIINQSSDKDTYLILTGVSNFLGSLSFVSVTGISADSSILLVTCDCVGDDNRIQEATIQDARRTQGNNQWK